MNTITCIDHLIEMRANRTPDAIAIAAPGRAPLTYGRLYRHIHDVVETLNAMGVGRNARVAIVLPNGPDMAVAFLAVAAGAASAPLNPGYRASEFDFYLSDLKAEALIIQSGVDSPALAVAQKRGISIIELTPAAEAGSFALAGEKRSRPVNDGFAQSEDVALVLHTSGTTSRPKIVPLTQGNICTSARNIRATLELAESDRCLNVMPLFHIHGLIGATLSSLLAGASVVCTPGFHASRFFEWMEEFRPTWYTAVPTIHQAILANAEPSREIIAHCPLRFIRSSSSALPPKVMTELESRFSTPVIESYGMTEASHQMASNPLPPSERKLGSVGVAAGPEISIMNEAGNLLPRGETGEIVIRGANVMLGYESNPTANEGAFDNGWFRTGDQGFLDPDAYLFVTGRLKEIINRGGEKISPHEIDEVLMEHPAVAQAVTFAVPHSELGEDVAAVVVLRESFSVTEMDIRKFAATKLADFKVPRQVMIADEIPKGATGKMQRIGLAEKLGLIARDSQRVASNRESVAPRDRLELQLTAIWEKVLGVRPIGITDDFFELGGYSLTAVSLLEKVEKAFGKNLSPAILLEASTIEQQASILRKEGWSQPYSSLVAIQPVGSKLPFFCIHGGSGSILRYRRLARHLGPEQPFYGLQPLGLERDQSPIGRLEDIAAHYAEQIRAVQPEGPYLLGGRCFGGIVAFELARQFQAQGQEVALLAILDSGPPKKGRTDSPGKNGSSRSLSHYARRLVFHLQNGEVNRLVADNTRVIVRNATRRLEAMVEYVRGSAYDRRLRRIEDAHAKAQSNYVPYAYPGRITLIQSSEFNARADKDWHLNWSNLARGGMDVHVVEGNHITMFEEPQVQSLGESLRASIDATKLAE